MNTFNLQTSQLDPNQAIVNEICAAGEPWTKIVKQGQFFRIVDLEGNQAVDTLFFNANHNAFVIFTLARNRDERGFPGGRRGRSARLDRSYQRLLDAFDLPLRIESPVAAPHADQPPAKVLQHALPQPIAVARGRPASPPCT